MKREKMSDNFNNHDSAKSQTSEHIDRRQFIKRAGIIGFCGLTAVSFKKAWDLMDPKIIVRSETDAIDQEKYKKAFINGEQISYKDCEGYPVLYRPVEFKPRSDETIDAEIISEANGIWRLPACNLMSVAALDERVQIERTGTYEENDANYVEYSYSVRDWSTKDKIILKAIYDKSATSDELLAKTIISFDNGIEIPPIDADELITHRGDVFEEPELYAAHHLLYDEIIGKAESLSEVLYNLHKHFKYDEAMAESKATPIMSDVEALHRGMGVCLHWCVLAKSCIEKYFEINGKEPPEVRIIRMSGSSNNANHIELQIKLDNGKYLRFDPQNGVIMQPKDRPPVDIRGPYHINSEASKRWRLSHGERYIELLESCHDSRFTIPDKDE